MKPISVISEAKLEELRGDPDVEILEHQETGDMVAVRCPTKSQWKRFKLTAVSDSPEKADSASEQLLMECLVYPPYADFQAILERRPGLADKFGAGVMRIAGGLGKVEKKD